MKNLVLSIILISILASCANHKYAQVYEIKSVVPYSKPNLVENKDLKVEYDFWEDGGKLEMKITNKTDTTLVIDFQNSYLLTNKNYQSLFNNDVTEVSKIYKKNKIYHQNIPKELNNKRLNYSNGRLKYTILTHSYQTPERIALPPNATYNYNNIALLNEIYYNDTFKFFNFTKKRNKVFNEISFNINNSPLIFENIIQYKIENTEQTFKLSNNFFVSGISNIYDPIFINPLIDTNNILINKEHLFYKSYEVENKKLKEHNKDNKDIEGFTTSSALSIFIAVCIVSLFFVIR